MGDKVYSTSKVQILCTIEVYHHLSMKCLLVILFLICIALVHITNAELELELGLDNVVETENTIDDSTFKLVVKELQDLLNSGKANEAFEIIQNLDPSHRQEESVLILYGRALVQLGKVHEGQAVFENILNVNPSSMDANLLMAKLHMRQSSWDTVEKYVASILQIDSLQITASKSLTSAALGTDISDLLTSLSDTTILKYAIAYSYLSKVVLIRDKDVNKALSLMSKAVELDPLNAEIQFDLGIMLFTVGKFSDGRRAFDETTRLGPALAQTASIANVYIQYGQFEWAIEALEQRLKSVYAAGQQPESSTLSLLGELLDSTGRTQDALTYYRDALRVDPKNAVAHAGIGLILLGTSNFNYASEHACGLNHEEALDHLQKAYQLDSTLQPVHDALMFCAKEISEVKFWRNVLSAQNEQSSSSSSSSSSAASLQLKTSSSDESDGSVVKTIIKKIIQPVRMAKQWVYTRLQQFGICVELNTNANSNTNGNIRSLVTEIVCKFFQPSSSKQTKLSFADSIKATLSTWAVREEFLPQVPHVTIDSADELQQLLRLNRPVVITNFQEKWDGSSSSNTKSKFDFSKNSLLERFGSEIVRVSVSESGRFDGPENGTLWGLGPSSDVLVRPPQTSMLLGDFITLLENSRYPDSIANETFYAEYLALHQYLGKEFSKLVPWPSFISESVPSVLSHLVSNVWLGGVQTSSPLHYDDYENFLSQVRGSKEITLFPPSDFPNLYYVKRPKGKLQYKYPSTFTRDVDALDKRAYVFGSSVHIDSPNLTLHPQFTNTHPVRALIQPGETLYIPAYWHHEAQSVPIDGDIFNSLATGTATADDMKKLNNPTGDYLNIAVNFWFKNLTEPFPGM